MSVYLHVPMPQAITNTLSIFASPETRFWGSIVFALVAALMYIGFKLTKGFIVGYLQAEIGDNAKGTMVIIHGLASLVLALSIPNNYLVKIDFFRSLYERNQLWVAVSIFTLLFMFLLAFGFLFTILAGAKGNVLRIKTADIFDPPLKDLPTPSRLGALA